MLRNVHRLLVTNVSGRSVCPIFIDQAFNWLLFVQTIRASSIGFQFIQWLCLFIYVFTFNVINLPAAQALLRNFWKIISQGCVKKRFLPNLALYPGICPKGLRKTMRNIQISWTAFWTRDLLNMKQISTLTKCQNIYTICQEQVGFGRKGPLHYLRYCNAPNVSVNGENREYPRNILCPCRIFKRGPFKYKSEVSKCECPVSAELQTIESTLNLEWLIQNSQITAVKNLLVVIGPLGSTILHKYPGNVVESRDLNNCMFSLGGGIHRCLGLVDVGFRWCIWARR